MNFRPYQITRGGMQPYKGLLLMTYRYGIRDGGQILMRFSNPQEMPLKAVTVYYTVFDGSNLSTKLTPFSKKWVPVGSFRVDKNHATDRLQPNP